MNKVILEKDLILKNKMDKTNISADIDRDNYKVFLSSLDIDRTIRIYQSLASLSDLALRSLKEGKSAEFSSTTDRMRPLLSYMSDNNVKLTNFLDENNMEDSEIVKRDPNIVSFVSTLRQNLKAIESARATMASIPFNNIFLSSQELTNAYLDYKLDLAWDFNYDLVIIFNLNDMRLIDYLVLRGQKRFLLVSGSIEPTECMSVIDSGGSLYKHEDDTPLLKQGGIPMFPGRPMHRYSILDVGEKTKSTEDIQKIAVGVSNDRNNQWARFNTINRADTTRVLSNLKNMSYYDQTLIYHNKFVGRGAVIVCPGPSLKKNIDLLKKVEGKVVILCVLHALKDLRSHGIKPDFVVHVDPVDLKERTYNKNGTEVSLWSDWIEDNAFSEVENLVVSSYSKPNIFEAPAKNVLWMSTGLPIGEHLPGKVFDYERVGGSVSHACFDLAIELGCSSIALIGQDLAFSKTGEIYSAKAVMDESEEARKKLKVKSYGADVEVPGWDGKSTVISNNTFIAFASAYSYFARELVEKEVQLFNCTEGGIYLEGFDHCRLQDFIEKELKKDFEEDVRHVLYANRVSTKKVDGRLSETKKFISRHRQLALEIDKLISSIIPIANKKNPSQVELIKFDKIQNKMIRKMKKNMFYSLGLQRDIHIFQAGLRADPSLGGQLGYHLDFLRVAQDLNKRFRRYFSEQLNLIQNI